MFSGFDVRNPNTLDTPCCTTLPKPLANSTHGQIPCCCTAARGSNVHGNFVRRGGGIQQIQLRTEDRENGDLGAVVPKSGALEAAVICYKKFHFI